MARGPLITRLSQLAAGGGWNMKCGALLAEDVRRGPHDFMLDQRPGSSPLLAHLSPTRYIGLDLDPADLAYARRRYSRPGYEFVQADFIEAPLDGWRGADVITASAVFNDLGDEQVRTLIGGIQDQVVVPFRTYLYFGFELRSVG